MREGNPVAEIMKDATTRAIRERVMEALVRVYVGVEKRAKVEAEADQEAIQVAIVDQDRGLCTNAHLGA